MFPRIGMRNIKTAISVLVCIIILKLLGFGSPFYACIAAVITMRNTVNVSYKTGLQRMIGTLIGAGCGIIFALISPHNIILITVGISLVIYITNLLKQNNSTSIACIVFLAIMTNLTSTTPLMYSTQRVIETFIGIIVAVVVNITIFPRKASSEDNHNKVMLLDRDNG